jgi:hypothetical protein
MSSTPPEQPQTRIEREISDIVQEARTRPISFEDRLAQKRALMQTRGQSSVRRAHRMTSGPLRVAGRWSLRLPLVTALIVALIATWVSPEFQFLGSLLALAAAALVFVPYVMRRPDTDVTHRKRWRGRDIGPGSGPLGRNGPRSRFDSARDRFGR